MKLSAINVLHPAHFDSLGLFGSHPTTVNSQAKLAARYGAPDIKPPKQWNDMLDQLLDHRSVRYRAPLTRKYDGR